MKNHLICVKFKTQSILSSLIISLTRYSKSRWLNNENVAVNDLGFYNKYFINIFFDVEFLTKFEKHNHELLNLIFFKRMLAQIELFIVSLKFFVDSILIKKLYSVFNFRFERPSVSFNIELFIINKFLQSVVVSFQNLSIVNFFLLF